MPPVDAAVVVPVFNRAQTVLATLNSVAGQSAPPKRLIVVDDGSTDGTSASVREWEEDTKPCFETVLLQQSNQGAGAARNCGLSAVADCRYVAFLDSDDRWPADFLLCAAGRLDATPSAIAATTDRRYFRQAKKRVAYRSSRGLAANATAWLLSHSSGITSSTLFRTSAVQWQNGFDRSIPTGQDVEFFLRMSLMGPWLHVPGAPVNYFVGFTAATGEAGNLSAKYANRQRRWVRIRERFLRQHHTRAELSPHFCRRLLARLWHKAGCAYLSHGQQDRAASCFRKALSYRRLRPSSWWRMGTSQLARIVPRARGNAPLAARLALCLAAVPSKSQPTAGDRLAAQWR